MISFLKNEKNLIIGEINLSLKRSEIKAIIKILLIFMGIMNIIIKNKN